VISRLAAAVAAALLFVACGEEAADGRYDAQVAEVRRAVEAGDRDVALVALDDLATTAFSAHAEGQISDAELAELDVLLTRARAQVDEELPESTTTTSTAAPTPTTSTTDPPTTPAPVFDAADERGKDDDKRGKDDKPGKKNKPKGPGGDDGDDDDD
jgi:hypothetical protein